jgi:hypothetical protein
MKPNLFSSPLILPAIAILIVVASFIALVLISHPGARIPPGWMSGLMRLIP